MFKKHITSLILFLSTVFSVFNAIAADINVIDEQEVIPIKDGKAPVNDVIVQVPDNEITNTILAKYAGSPLLNVFELNVSTVDGNVNISGQVDTLQQYEKAIVLAGSTAGVKDISVLGLIVNEVANELNDLIIQAKIKAFLIRDNLVTDENYDAWPIVINVNVGNVYIAGIVDSVETGNKIITLITQIDGVKSVKSDFKY